jgi:mRNA interferase MazF
VVIRGTVYRVDLGEAKRGHEQRGRHLGLVLSPSSMPWNMATIIPSSATAQPAVFRPTLEINGQLTRFLVDQTRTIDIDYVRGDPVYYLDRDELAEIEHAVTCHLGLWQ